ncbi:MAG TPA: FtsQ-type POTRA domain-containing protein, partial [Anaerolineales bacterium]|nr:FtsQ-type POTRA domain-containing protein [Anaerolineales bacterium]
MRNERERSRAEAVRMRRREQSQKRVSRSSEMATRPLPPITSRGGMSYAGSVRAAPTRSTRKYQSALSMPGIEVRLPAVQITGEGIRARVLPLLMCLLLGTALYMMANLPEFRAAPAQVTGNERIGADEINAILNSTGQSIFTLRSDELETRLRLNDPDLASAQVSIGLPNTVHVKVVERQPVVLWQQGSGYTWIDADGIAFRPHGTPGNLITVDALAAPPTSTATQADPLSPVPYISP